MSVDDERREGALHISPTEDKYIVEVVRLLGRMTTCGKAVVLNKAQEMAKAYPIGQCTVLPFPGRGSVPAVSPSALQ